MPNPSRILAALVWKLCGRHSRCVAQRRLSQDAESFFAQNFHAERLGNQIVHTGIDNFGDVVWQDSGGKSDDGQVLSSFWASLQRISRVAARPSITGMLTSISTISYGVSIAMRRASLAIGRNIAFQLAQHG